MKAVEDSVPRSISRYRNFNPEPIKIHPLKRLASRLASGLPRAWRFFVMGLPARADETAAGHGNGGRVLSGMASVSKGIACRQGATLTSSGTYIPSLTSGAGPFIETRFLQKQRCFPKIRTVPGTVASVVLEGQINYYRWLMEVLPRMRFLKEARAAHDWIYACQQYPFHRESLKMLGCDPSRIIDCGQVPYLRADELLVPRFVDESEAWIIPWLREQFLPRVPANKGEPLPRRIHVARTKATGRRVANREKFAQLMESLGFVTVIMEDYGWLEQLALFRGAEAIVAPHGAGLANLVFCSPSTLTVELIAENYPFTFYPEISRRLKLDHRLISCAPIHPSAIEASDIQVPLDQLQSVLKALQ